MGTAEVSVTLDGIILVELRGQIVGDVISKAIMGAGRAMRTHRAKHFIIDASEATGYSADVRGPGLKLLETLANHGAERGVGVTTSSSIRMMAAAIGLVAPVQMDFQPTREKAFQVLLHERRRAAP